MLPEHPAADARATQRFAKQVREMCRIDHPNLVRVETAGQHEAIPYLVMEYVEGIDLEKLLAKLGSISPADACQLIGQAAVGLEHLQERGLVPSTIETSSLILTPSGRLKVAYSSKLRKDNLCKEVHGLGSALYTLLAGHPPRADGAPDLAMIPPRVCDLVGQWIRRDRGERVETWKQGIQELARHSVGCDLPSLIENAGIASSFGASSLSDTGTSDYLWLQAEGMLEGGKRPARWQPRNLRFASLAVLGLSLLVVGWFTWSSGLEPPTNPMAAAEHPRDSLLTEFTESDPEQTSSNPSTQETEFLTAIDPVRDAFDVQVECTSAECYLTNLQRRGIVQVPLVMPESYSLEFSVERLEGDGSFGFGFSVGDGRMMALLDHRVGEEIQSGMYFAGSSHKSGIADPWFNSILLEGVPVKMRLDVSPQLVELWRIDPSQEAEPTLLSRWNIEDDITSDGPHTPALTLGVESFYPGALFVHVHRGAFRLGELQVLNTSEAPKSQPFLGFAGSSERRLAERIVWRGGHVEIITDEGTEFVHGLEKLTAEPWIVGVEKCGAAPRLMIQDSDLRELASIKGMRKLDLSETAVSSNGLMAVSSMPTLTTLSLPRNGLEATVLTKLHDLPQLRELQLIGVPIGDRDVGELARFPLLNRLCLTGSEVTDGGVEAMVESLTELRHLCLSETKVTGECLPRLGVLRELEDLQLDHTLIDDETIKGLPELPKLTKLTLSGSRVSNAALEELHQSRPGLTIE